MEVVEDSEVPAVLVMALGALCRCLWARRSFGYLQSCRWGYSGLLLCCPCVGVLLRGPLLAVQGNQPLRTCCFAIVCCSARSLFVQRSLPAVPPCPCVALGLPWAFWGLVFCRRGGMTLWSGCPSFRSLPSGSSLGPGLTCRVAAYGVSHCEVCLPWVSLLPGLLAGVTSVCHLSRYIPVPWEVIVTNAPNTCVESSPHSHFRFSTCIYFFSIGNVT